MQAQTIVFDGGDKIMPIGGLVYFLEDKTGALTIADMEKPTIQTRFKRSAQEIPNFANTRSTIWCRLTVENHTAKRCILQIEKTLIHHIEFFYPSGEGQYTSRLTGALYPISSRDIKDNFFLFNLLLANETGPATYYIRFASEESLEIPLSLSTPDTLLEEHKKQEILYGSFFGLMVALMIYNLFIYFTVREKYYLYYVFYLISMLWLNDIIISGIGFEYIWPEMPAVNFYANAYTGFVYIIVIMFSSSFLNTAANTPRLHKGLYVFYFISGVIIVMNLFGEFFIGSIISQVGGFLLGMHLIIIGIVTYRKGIPAARFYLIGWTVFLACGMSYVLFLNGILPSTKFTRNATILGSALEGILLSLALADRINILRREKIQAQQEKLQFIVEQNDRLERLVAERTHEVVAQNEEIASQNEELVAQQDQITAQNEALVSRNQALEAAHGVIERQHLVLKEYSENLEQEINLRAKDLVKTNQELVEQNHQLEQFAFITAHNLRAPVARIQGLASILDLCKREDERQTIIQKMIESSQELDHVIHDLAKILEIKKGTIENYETVSLSEKMDRVKSMLRDEIVKTGAVILCDFKAVDTLFSLPQYIESILYNLVSNAIKYKSPHRKPEIDVQSIKMSNAIYLIIKDNGIGVDVALYREKLFGLYQRFHDHVEGKGLGLHLVKTQVESLGGKIEIQSKPDEGATFVIILPTKVDTHK